MKTLIQKIKGARVLKTKLKELKTAIREWMGSLSIEEIMINRELSTIFKNIERKIKTIEAQYV